MERLYYIMPIIIRGGGGLSFNNQTAQALGFILLCISALMAWVAVFLLMTNIREKYSKFIFCGSITSLLLFLIVLIIDLLFL